MSLNIECRAETVDDITRLCDYVQKAMAVSVMGKNIIDVEEENYYELENAFELIRDLLEPVETFLCYGAVDLMQEFGKRKKRKGDPI